MDSRKKAQKAQEPRIFAPFAPSCGQFESVTKSSHSKVVAALPRCVLFLAFSLFTLCAAARPALLQTLDGRTFNGDVQFTNGAFTVDTTNAVPLTNLLRLSFGGDLNPSSSARGGGNGLLGFYFANTNLSGDPWVRLDENINFDWGLDEPVPELPKDQFSVIWTGELEVPAAGGYTCSFIAEDGGRLLLDGKVVAEGWHRQPGEGVTGSALTLHAGQRVPLRFEYVHSSGPARAQLFWQGPNTARSPIPKDRLHARSALTNHTATLGTSTSGLLATYYQKPDFTGPSWTRIDPSVDFDWSSIDPLPGYVRGNFSVRWSGQFLADNTEVYTFYVLADEPARLWIDGKLLLAIGGDNFFFERRESTALVGGERHDIRLETASKGGNAVAKLAWSSPSTPKAPVPVTHLFPSRPTPTRDPLIDLSDKTPPGVLLRNGTFIAGTVESATDNSVRLGGLLKGTPVSTVNIARILFQPLAKKLEERIRPGRAGLLLSQGDFIDAEFRGVDGSQVRAGSVLFGMRTYDAKKDVLAAILRQPAPGSSDCEVRLKDGSVLYASAITGEADALLVREPTLGPIKVPSSELTFVARRQ
jgi:hypothetical protein